MDGIDHILFPTDLSPAAGGALAHAGFLAEALGARLVLYHVAAIPVSEYAAWGAGKEAEVWRRVDAAAREELERRAQGLKAAHEIVVRHDAPSARVLVDLSVLDQIRRTHPGLVIMPMQSRSGFSRFFVGSVTEEVVRHAGVPVLALRDAPAPPSPYRVIVVATDLSPASRRVFPAAALLARRFGARVVAVHVPDTGAAVPAGPADVKRFVASDFADASVRIGQAPAWRGIVQAAVDEKADVVAVARQGADNIGEEILGTTTDRVLRHAPCPVLVA